MPATALEQLILELVNRARLDPAAEAARYGIALNEGVPAADTISTASKQPLAMNETLLGTARTHSQDMIDRDYFAHDTPEGLDPFERMNNAGYNFTTAGENIADVTSSNPITNQNSIFLHQILFVDTNFPGRGHRVNILNGAYQEIGVGQVTGDFQGSNASMLTEDFGTQGNQQFLTGVSYADADHDNFYSIGEGRGSMLVANGILATSTAAAGGYSLAVGTGLQTVTFSGGGLASQISVAVSIAAHTNAKVDVIDQGTIATSASLTDLGGATKIIGLGTFGLALTGDSGNDTFVGTKGNDTIDGAGGSDTAIFSGNFAAYTLTTLGNGVQVAGADGTDTLLNVEHFQFNDQTVDAPGSVVAKHSDFNGDGFSDALWRNNSSGDSGYTDFHASNTWHGLGASSTAYSVVGSGDFNGDGFSDILYRSAASGDTGYSDVHGNAWHGLGAASTAYSVVGTGDFNGDHFADILWRDNSSGDTGYSDVHGNAWHSLGASSTAYNVVGTGDFNGDGFSDVLWRNNSSGDTGYSDLHGNAWHGLGASSTAYNVVGTGDFNGDGFSDVLWRNNSSGEAGYSDLHGNAWHGLGASSTAYSVVAVGDYSGGGFDDILYRNGSNGDTGYLDVQANAWHGIGAASTDYSVVA